MNIDEIRPGDVRVFNKRGSVVLAVGVWPKRRGKQLHIDITGPKEFFHATITNDTTSDRYHRTLFRNLRRVLIANDCWAFGDEGAETENANTKAPRKS
jgi:hypothetical protein